MANQKELIQKVKSKNRLSNVLLCLKILLDLIPQILIIHMVGLVFLQSLSTKQIILNAGAMLCCYILKAACAYGAEWKAHEAAYHCLTELRIKIIEHLKKLPLGFFQDRTSGDLTTIVQHDVEQVEIYLAHGLPEIMSATLLPVVIFFIMLALDWRLAVLVMTGLPFMWLTKKISSPLWQKNFRIFADSTTKMQDSLMEYISNISVIKAFGKEENKTEKTIRSAKAYVYWVKKSMAGISVPMGLIGLFMESGVVFIMIVGTWLLSTGELSVTKFILSIILGTAFTSAITKTATLQHYKLVFNQAMAGIGSILTVPAPQGYTSSEAAADGDIEIQNLNFSYQNQEDTLKNIHLVFKKGSKNALVGASGCGKSTLANLLMGFWKPDSGTIRVAGRDIWTLSQKQIGALFSIVQQEVFLFNLSMEENIRIGKPDASKEEIISAAKKARIHDFIMSLPKGYDTLAGEGGVKFSGGEKQRISIARIILKNAPIVILDEATAAVDAENEAYIQAAIEDLSQNKTVIMIAHHLNTIQNAAQIAVMDKGTLIDCGTHTQLMKRCELYRKMVHDQDRVDHWNIREV